MTNVHYWDKRDCQEIEINGHAEQTGPGQVSAVCAAVSAITHTLYENIKREEEKGQVKAWVTAEKGHMFLRAETTAENEAAIRNMFDFVMVGLKAVAKAYPDKVMVKEEKRNGNI